MKRVLGLAFVILLAGLVTLSVLAYRKAFTPATWVTLRADHTGMQLNPGAEVKLRGVVVGEVREIASDGTGARLRLALDPASTAQIPGNVSARLLPKTLFGERYVALVPGPDPAPSIRDGAVIPQDRTESAIELERVLDGALPLLQAIQPDKLAATLGALAYAVEGRGERLGGDIQALDKLLAQLNARMPAIAEDVRLLADTLAVYDGAAEDLLAILRDATVTATTIADQRSELAAFLTETTTFAGSTVDFLDRHGDQIIQLGRVGRPVLELLAVYSPEYPCLLAGVVALQPQAEEVFATGRMHVTLELTRDSGKYVAGRDDPVYAARNGPNCRGLPGPAVPAHGVELADGYGGGASMGRAGTLEEQAVVAPLIAAASGTPVRDVPDVAVLLWGPLMRGTVVNTT
ncbi:MAG TPA: MCE family protein [Micromonosporaceae bacterium]|nr:MCE family protein [Micromonosporaceae bacterium]